MAKTHVPASMGQAASSVVDEVTAARPSGDERLLAAAERGCAAAQAELVEFNLGAA